MAVLLQINEIVSGPIKDLLVHISGGNFPEIKLPNISLPEVNLPELPPMSSPTYPEEVNLEVGGSLFRRLGFLEFPQRDWLFRATERLSVFRTGSQRTRQCFGRLPPHLTLGTLLHASDIESSCSTALV